MFVVRDKTTKETIFIDHTPAEAREVPPEEVWPEFDPATMEIGITDKSCIPAHFEIDERGEIVETSLERQIEAGAPVLTPTQKLVGGKVEEKTIDELVEEGLIDRDTIKSFAIRRLRAEIATYFQQQRTPNGYSLDELARQKASFSSQYRALPDDDPTKMSLLEDGVIYPDAILDEILAEVKKIQAAYGAAKKAIVTACDAGEPVASWAEISIRDHLPG
ncbi:MAG: hypothetical protein PVG07_02580 [Acidobacteriota bacterium]|jgi:hypothetical protein